LTAEGEEVIREAFAHHERETEHPMKSLSPQERKSVIAWLKKLGKSVQAAP
jgi:hypothetical protein